MAQYISSHGQLITLSKASQDKSGVPMDSRLSSRSYYAHQSPRVILEKCFFFFPLLPFGTIQLSIPSRPIVEFFIDIILAALHRETSPWKWLGRRAGLTNEFRRAVVPGRLRFEVLSLAGNQPGWQMFAETSTSLSFFLRFFRGQTRSVPPPPSLTFVVYVLRTGKTSAPGREKR